MGNKIVTYDIDAEVRQLAVIIRSLSPGPFGEYQSKELSNEVRKALREALAEGERREREMIEKHSAYSEEMVAQKKRAEVAEAKLATYDSADQAGPEDEETQWALEKEERVSAATPYIKSVSAVLARALRAAWARIAELEKK